MTYGITARVAFDNKCKDHVQEELITAVREGAEATGGFKVADVFPSIKILQVIKHKASKEEAENTGKDKANDLLGVLLDLQEHGELEVPLTMNNIKAVLLDIFTAWSETSSSTVEWAMSEMLKTPKSDEKGTSRGEAGLLYKRQCRGKPSSGIEILKGSNQRDFESTPSYSFVASKRI
ncbi:PREDICTED: cytochrome P450 [Prunus dulcis]|uniref:PREDICTED: cytochrome P450 n=1 Tax=Prunus dulcis TaxID=3755 RepID=A0A5E4G2U7_PRUDU|nr:PREDICTED: cytochrome P450 [Prunus dulcis]